MAVDDGLEPEVIMQANDSGPPAITPKMAAGMLEAWLADNWGAANARFVCRVEAGSVVIEHHEETSFQRGDAR